MWRCAKCGETVEDDGFLVCWNCGGTREPGATQEAGAAAPPPLPPAAAHTCSGCSEPLTLRGRVPTREAELELEAWGCPRCRRVVLYEGEASSDA